MEFQHSASMASLPSIGGLSEPISEAEEIESVRPRDTVSDRQELHNTVCTPYTNQPSISNYGNVEICMHGHSRRKASFQPDGR